MQAAKRTSLNPSVVLTWKRDRQTNTRFPEKLFQILERETNAYNKANNGELSVSDYIILKLAQPPVGE